MVSCNQAITFVGTAEDAFTAWVTALDTNEPVPDVRCTIYAVCRGCRTSNTESVAAVSDAATTDSDGLATLRLTAGQSRHRQPCQSAALAMRRQRMMSPSSRFKSGRAPAN